MTMFHWDIFQEKRSPAMPLQQNDSICGDSTDNGCIAGQAMNCKTGARPLPLYFPAMLFASEGLIQGGHG
jgi:hypothetical protein